MWVTPGKSGLREVGSSGSHLRRDLRASMIRASAQENRATSLPALLYAPAPPRRCCWRKHAGGDLTFQHGGGGRLGPRVEAATAAGGPCRKRLPPPPPLTSLLGQGARARWGEWGFGQGRVGSSSSSSGGFHWAGRYPETVPNHWLPSGSDDAWVSVSECVTVSERVCVPALLCPRVLKASGAHFFVTGPVQRGPTADACWAGLPERAATGGGARHLPHTAVLPHKDLHVENPCPFLGPGWGTWTSFWSRETVSCDSFRTIVD